MLPGDRFYLFVDDCSTDGTVEVIHESFKHSAYHVIGKDKNAGPGDSFSKGFHWILDRSKSDDDLVVTMEGDNTADLATLPKMITISQLGYDLVLASVYAQGGDLEKTNLYRKVLSFSANMLLRGILDLKVSTISSFYRVYHKSLLKSIADKSEGRIIDESGFICKVEVLVKAVKAGAKVIEVPTRLLSEKRQGVSKMKTWKTFIEYLVFVLRPSL